MESAKLEDDNFFDKFGLEVREGQIEVGKTYPILGVITRFLEDDPGNVRVEINHNITASIKVFDPEKVETLKQRAFESGIFVIHVVEKEPNIVVICKTIIFGTSQACNA